MNQSLIDTFDKQNYLKVLRTFDEQLLSAEKNISVYYPELSRFKSTLGGIRNIVICGMGGSAIAGDFVKQIFADKLPVPVIVSRDYTLPAFVNESSIVIFSSYSGNTEETISALRDAISKKAKMVAVSTGGELAAIAKQHALPHISIPPGFQPRQAIGFSLVTLFRLVEHLFFDSHDTEAVNNGVSWIKEKKEHWLSGNNNELWDLAEHLHRHPVIVYSSEQMFPAALRFKGQICENAKLLAFAYALPEMNHNEIVGWAGIGSDAPFSVVTFRDTSDHGQIQKRFDILKTVLYSKTEMIEYRSEGKELFSRFLSLIFWGDCVSYFIAIMRKIDPTPVDIITHFKNELSK
jgi:glucose/mannose-6-phosphate isomerase